MLFIILAIELAWIILTTHIGISKCHVRLFGMLDTANIHIFFPKYFIPKELLFKSNFFVAFEDIK